MGQSDIIDLFLSINGWITATDIEGKVNYNRSNITRSLLKLWKQGYLLRRLRKKGVYGNIGEYEYRMLK